MIEGMGPSSSPYRDGSDAVRARLDDVRARLDELDGQLARHLRPLPIALRRRLDCLRDEAALPPSASADDLVRSERAMGDLEREVDEMLGLAAALQRTVDPVVPPRAVLMRWAGLLTASSTLLVVGVLQLGLGDFMLQAFGVEILRAHAMPFDRLSFEAHRAANGGEAPAHAEWVDPEPR